MTPKTVCLAVGLLLTVNFPLARLLALETELSVLFLVQLFRPLELLPDRWLPVDAVEPLLDEAVEPREELASDPLFQPCRGPPP